MEQQEFVNNVHEFIKIISLYLHHEKAHHIVIDKSKLSFFLRFAKSHSLRALLYKAIKETGCKIDKEDIDKLEEYYLFNIRKSMLFERDREALYNYLNKNEIEFLPLKGLVINKFYPDQFIREYADYDIMFEGSGKPIREFCVNHGYEVKLYEKSNHDVYIKKPFYNFEMHRELFAGREDLKIFIPYFKNYLKNAPVKQGHEHYLKLEDFYIYFTAHSHKHYAISGCGVRTLVDYYIFTKRNELDFAYINKELEKLELLEFSNKIINLSNKLFDNEPLNDEEEEMLLYIASSGTYGTMEHRVNKALENRGKFSYFMSRVFPPMEVYRVRYPWAYKTKVLIPIAWFLRLLQGATVDHKKAKSELHYIRKHKKDN